MRASPYRLSKAELFTSSRQHLLAMMALLSLFLLSLFLKYQTFQNVCKFDDFYTRAVVMKQYAKKDYWVLRCHSEDGFDFFTTSRSNLKALEGETLEVRLFIKELSFWEFLQGFYAPSELLYRVNDAKSQRHVWMEKLAQGHDRQSAEIFNALFFAGGITQELRNKLSAWGINHLLAISGFHLGVLSMLLFFLLKWLYYPIQKRFFPFSHGHRDVTLVVLMIMGGYVYFLDMVPSLLRAFAMTLFAFLLYDRGMKLLSFSALFYVVGLLLALWPDLLFAMGFWFSVAGVFYIFLFLHHFESLANWQHFILLHIWVFIAMLPIVHYFFGSFSPYQLLSPLLSMVFILFYPLSLLLHAVAMGELLDPVLGAFFSVRIIITDILINDYVFVLTLILSFLAIFHRVSFYGLLLFDLVLLGYFLYGIA